MSPVLHLRKHLSDRPAAEMVSGISVREMLVPGDIAEWLALRERAMFGERPAVRSWGEVDFRREMMAKTWWRSDRAWVACCDESPGEFIGAVTLAMREGRSIRVPVVHWLLVDPARRRRGIGRMLIAHLERVAWGDGWREVQLETHAGWAAAVACYQSMGYASLEADLSR